MKNKIVSKALEQIWDWKAAIYNGVKDRPLKDALKCITENAGKAASTMGFTVQSLRKEYSAR